MKSILGGIISKLVILGKKISELEGIETIPSKEHLEKDEKT
jgi:hypothetical protein